MEDPKTFKEYSSQVDRIINKHFFLYIYQSCQLYLKIYIFLGKQDSHG